MPITSVSISSELWNEMKKRGISPSKAFRIGVDTCIRGGDNLLNVNSKLKTIVMELTEELELKKIKINSLEKNLSDARERLLNVP